MSWTPVFSLPDDRGWEMVSPTDKNGGEIQSFGQNHGGGVLQAAAQGGADHLHLGLLLCRPARLAGAQPVPLEPRRAGWSTENITLPMLSGTYPESPTSGVPYQLFSSDLQGALVSNGRRCRTSAETQCPVENAPLPGSGAPAGYRNYYLRSGSGLLQSAAHRRLPRSPPRTSNWTSPAPPPTSPTSILSSCAALTPDATEVPGTEGECDPAKQNLYERQRLDNCG